MEQLQGFEDSNHPNWVCEVHQSMYGLKQSPRKWNLELHGVLVDCGLTQSTLTQLFTSASTTNAFWGP
jgi:hypothetical protein